MISIALETLLGNNIATVHLDAKMAHVGYMRKSNETLSKIIKLTGFPGY